MSETKAAPPPSGYDTREAMFLADQFLEKHAPRGRMEARRHELAVALIQELGRFARDKMRCTLDSNSDGTARIIFSPSRMADVRVLETGEIQVGHADPPGDWMAVPIRYSPIFDRLEGMRPLTNLVPGTQPWEAQPRSPLAVLTEAVLKELDRGAGQKKSAPPP